MDVILLDACMPGISGFAATKELKKLLPKVGDYSRDDVDGSHFRQRGVSGRREWLH